MAYAEINGCQAVQVGASPGQTYSGTMTPVAEARVAFAKAIAKILRIELKNIVAMLSMS